MNTLKHLLNILIITAVFYLLFALVNWSLCTLDWNSASKYAFVVCTLVGWFIYVMLNEDI